MSILLLCLFAFLPLNAQKLVAEKTVVDVGKTGYQQPVTAVFKFRNKGGRKLRIEEVRPDCRCTTVDYPKGEIGEKFEIRMTYDARQLGHFDKQALVVSNGAKSPFYIRMKGVVLQDYVDVSGKYPVEMGYLMLDKAELVFDDVRVGDQQVQELHLYNDGTQMCRPNLMHLPSYLTAMMIPEQLRAGQEGVMQVILNPSLVHNYGLTQNSVYLAANPGDTVRYDREITVSTILLSTNTDTTGVQRMYAPRLQLSKETVEIRFNGKKKKGDIIEVANHGRSDLNISSLQLFTRGLEVSLGKRVLKPGEKTKLRVTALREQLKKVRARPRVLMTTNDPANPKIIININAH